MDRRLPRNPPARPLVLVVEGYEYTGAIYALALSAAGFDVVALQDSGDACRRALEIHPDVIVADLPIPGHDQVLGDLTQNSGTRDIPIVAVSDCVQRTVEESVECEGFAAFFRKRCLPDELAVGLRRVLDGHAHVQHWRPDEALSAVPAEHHDWLLAERE